MKISIFHPIYRVQSFQIIAPYTLRIRFDYVGIFSTETAVESEPNRLDMFLVRRVSGDMVVDYQQSAIGLNAAPNDSGSNGRESGHLRPHGGAVDVVALR